jgi:hypothetical protein
MEIAIAIISVVITVFLWLFPPEPLRKRFRLNSKKDDESGSLGFLIRFGELSDDYWDKVDAPLKTFKIAPFQEQCSQFFQSSSTKFVDDVDPSFDITLVSELNSAVVLYELGIEIVSVAHEMKSYGEPQAAKILQQASYTIEIPDIRADIASELGRFPKLLEPRNINMSLSVPKPDLFRLEPEGTFRYELLLKNYVAHMPNYAVLRFWVLTQNRKYTSDLIHVFTL